MDAPTILRPVRAKAYVCCYALTGRKEKHMAIPQGVALGYKIKGFQPTRYYHVNEYAERKFCSSATLVNYHLYCKLIMNIYLSIPQKSKARSIRAFFVSTCPRSI